MSHLALVVLLSFVGENRTDQHSRILDHHLTRGDIAGTKQATPVNWRPWLKEKEIVNCLIPVLGFQIFGCEGENAQRKRPKSNFH